MNKKALISLLMVVISLTACSQSGVVSSTPTAATNPYPIGTATSGPSLAGTPYPIGTPASQATPEATPSSEPTVSVPNYGQTLLVMTHDSFSVSEPVVAEFENQNHVNVQFIKSGDAGTALNKAILSKSNPLADVFYGVDNTFLSRALDEGIYEPYHSPLLQKIPDQFKLDPQDRSLPVDYADVCLVYDKNYFQNKNLTPPQNLQDLLKPEYKNLLVVENPSTSSPGLAFLITTISNYGENGYLDYWKGLVANNVKVVDGWESAFYTEFSGASSGGSRPIVVSYSSDPAFSVISSSQPSGEPTIAAITSDKSCFRQIEFVGILKGTKHLSLAQKWVDFMLSKTFQEDMPLQMYVFPVNPEAKLAPVFQKYMQQPQLTSNLSYETIATNRQKWLQAWTETVLH